MLLPVFFYEFGYGEVEVVIIEIGGGLGEGVCNGAEEACLEFFYEFL